MKLVDALADKERISSPPFGDWFIATVIEQIEDDANYWRLLTDGKVYIMYLPVRHKPEALVVDQQVVITVFDDLFGVVIPFWIDTYDGLALNELYHMDQPLKYTRKGRLLAAASRS